MKQENKLKCRIMKEPNFTVAKSIRHGKGLYTEEIGILGNFK